VRLFYCTLLVLLVSVTFTEGSAIFERNVETITIPHSAFNAQGSSVEHFEPEHASDWLLAIHNNLIYNTANPESSIVLRVKEYEQSEEYIELVMDRQNKIFITVNSKETGYLPIDNGESSWFKDKPLILHFSEVKDGNGERVSISNSQRNMVDRLKLGEFEARTIEFYSIGYSQNLPVVIDGQIKLEILSGDPFPIMLTLVFVGFGAATYLTLRRLKSRKDWYAKW